MPTATPFNNLITFSRGSDATVTGPNGLIQWAPNNLLTNSESFNAAAWVKNASTVTANVTASPDGAVNADKMVETATTDRHAVYQAFTYGAGLVYAATVYAKKAERNWIYLGADTSAAEAVFFDLDTGTVGSQGTGYVGSITNAGNGWYRCTVIITQSTALPPNFLVVGLASANNTPSYAGNGTSGVFIWGAQLEIGSTATTYNSTTVKNLLGFSEALDNPAWTKGNSSIVTGAQANPVNALFTAQKLMENTANAEHSCRQSASGLIANTPLTVSVYLKAAERTIARVLNLDGANFYGIFVDLSNGSFISTSTSGTFSNGSYSIASVGSGWFRVSVTATIAGTARSLYINTGVSGPSASYTGDGNSGVYIYGAQLSDSASLDPYVPTPGAAPSSTAFYGPRFDFDPVTLAPRGLLVEEQRTNLMLRSDAFQNAVWVDISAGVTTKTGNFAVAPDGTTTACRIQGNNTNTWLAQSATGTFNGQTLTWSFWARANSGMPSGVSIIISVSGGSSFNVPITVTSAWQRFTLTSTLLAGDTGSVRAAINHGNGNDILVWGAQLEAGAFATSYIPTVASTVTRSADVATITGQNFAQWYRQPEGTLVAEFSGPSGGYPLNMTDGTTNNATGIVYVGATTLRGISVVSGAGRFVDMAASAAPAVNKTSYGYRLNDLGGSTNNGAVVANTTAPIPTLDRMFVGTFSNFSFLNGHIRNIRFIPARAADFQLQALST